MLGVRNGEELTRFCFHSLLGPKSAVSGEIVCFHTIGVGGPSYRDLSPASGEEGPGQKSE